MFIANYLTSSKSKELKISKAMGIKKLDPLHAS